MTSSSPAVAITSDRACAPDALCLTEMETAACPNIRFAVTAPDTQPATWAGRETAAARQDSPPSAASANDTTGLKCAPDTGPNMRMTAYSPAAVTAAFSSSSSPASDGDNRCAAIPEPITIAARKALPRNSAASRRGSTGALVTPLSLTDETTSVKIESMNTEQSHCLARRAAIHAALADPARLLITDTLTEGDASPSELAALLAMPSNLLAHHLRVLEQAGLITRRRSDGDRRRTYLRLAPADLYDAHAGPPARTAPRVLFVCTANSARSHLAAALWRGGRRAPA